MSLKALRDRQATRVAEARERLDLISAATDEARAKELEIQHDAAMAEYYCRIRNASAQAVAAASSAD